MYNMIIIISHTYIHYILINSGEDEEGEDADVWRAQTMVARPALGDEARSAWGDTR